MVCHSCHSEHEVAKLCRTVVRAGTGTQWMGRPDPAPPPAADPLLGLQLGNFRLIRRIGGGGMGSVYLGEHAGIGSRVAVKVLHPHLAQNESLVNRFRAEALAVNLIGHENIVSIFDLSVAPSGQHYLVMEHLEGRPLSDLVSDEPLEPRSWIPILIQVCDALSAAHRRGVVHRDLKPDNIFLTPRGSNEHFVKLLDFGIAKLADAQIGPQTSQGMIVGTPEYMAPEQYVGGAIDGRADLYALGTIAYQLATGALPFRAANLAAMMLAHQELAPASPAELNPQISRRLSDTILQALAKRPENRFRDAAQMKAALLASLEPTVPDRAPPRYPVQVSCPPHTDQRSAQAQELSRGGVFLSAQGFAPPLRSRLKVTLTVPGGTLELTGEVVRLVTEQQSAAWGMPPGVGLQFVELSPRTREGLDRVLAGKPLETPPPVAPDPGLERELQEWKRRCAKDFYTLLDAPTDADFDTLRARAREAKLKLEALWPRAQKPEQSRIVEQARLRLIDAVHALIHPQRRAEHDAGTGNYRGVARCIAAGLTVTELERARNRFLPEHPGNESRARIHAATAEAHLAGGDRPAGLAAYEQALSEDPLTLRYHQRYWSLRRQTPAHSPSTSHR